MNAVRPSPRDLAAIRRARAWIAGVCLVICSAFPQLAAGGEYQLGTQDKLTIRVVEWQTVEGTFRDWSSVSGEYTVGPSGNLSLPFIGELPAAGKTTADIADTIGRTLQEKFGLSDKPEASVELAQYRPFYISGDIQASGQYPYAPDLTVLKAVSIAGGTRHGADADQRTERDIINAKGNFDILADRQTRLLVTGARIDAELAGKSGIETPGEVAAIPNVARIVADETAIMAARQKKISLRLGALDDLKSLLEREIISLEKKAVTQRRQVELAKKELSGIGALAEKGLVVNTRVLSTERSVADMEGKILDLETAVLRARQDISKATQDAIDLTNNTVAELSADKQQVQADLNEVALTLRMQRGLMSEALGLAPASMEAANGEPSVSFVIVRTVDGAPVELGAGENTPVLPGDVIKVKLVGLPVQ